MKKLSRLKPSNSTGTDIEAVSLKNIVHYTFVFIDSMASFLLEEKLIVRLKESFALAI